MDSDDKKNMKAMLEEFPDQIERSLNLGKEIKIDGPVNAIVILGMGGSGIPGDMLKNYLADSNIQVLVNKDYMAPTFIDKRTLVFAISYSGDTEETISAYRDAIRKNAKVVAITSGGKLEGLAEINKNPIIKVPSGLPPRLSTGYLFFPMLNVLKNSGMISSRDDQIRDAVRALRQDIFKEPAQKLAKELYKKIPLIYSSVRYSSVAMKWKTDINENAKVHAFYNLFSEFNHNELNGYVNKNGDYHVIMLRDDDELIRNIKRMKVVKSLIKERGIPVTEMAIKGKNLMTKLFSAMYMGLWVSYYLALEYSTDPTPVKMIEDLKKQLKDI